MRTEILVRRRDSYYRLLRMAAPFQALYSSWFDVVIHFVLDLTKIIELSPRRAAPTEEEKQILNRVLVDRSTKLFTTSLVSILTFLLVTVSMGYLGWLFLRDIDVQCVREKDIDCVFMLIGALMMFFGAAIGIVGAAFFTVKTARNTMGIYFAGDSVYHIEGTYTIKMTRYSVRFFLGDFEIYLSDRTERLTANASVRVECFATTACSLSMKKKTLILVPIRVIG